MLKSPNKEKITKPKPVGRQGAPGRGVVQDWLPVRDIHGGMLVRKDGALAVVIRVDPAPFALLSEREQDRRIASLQEVIQMLPGQAQIFALPRPIDLDAYIASLESLVANADGPRRSQLRGYLAYVRGLAMSAGATERRY